MRTRVKGVFVFLIILFFTFEITLQMASVIVNLSLNKRVGEKEVAKEMGGIFDEGWKILCMGDSFTQGVGASTLDNSYPEQLKNYLQRDPSYKWEVENGGAAGTNSSELAVYLPKLLEHHNPDFLSVLIGINDRWNTNFVREASMKRNKDILNASKFIPWKVRFRTYRLAKMILRYFHDKRIAEGNVSKSKEVLSGPQEGIFQITNDSKDLFVFGKKMLSEGKSGEAEKIFKNIAAREPENWEACIQLAYAYIRQKKLDQALSCARKVKEEISGKAVWAHLHLAWFFINAGDFQAARDEIDQHKKYSSNDDRADDASIYEALSALYFETFEHEKAKYYLKKLMEEFPKRTYSYRLMARLYTQNKGADLQEALGLLIEAYNIDKDLQETELYISVIGGIHQISLDSFRKVLNKKNSELEMNDESYNAIYKAATMIIERQDMEAVMAANLSNIVSVCSKNGVKPVFITYPMVTEINTIIRNFCIQNNQLIIDSEPVFTEFLEKGAERRKYFQPDNHLTDKGYHVLAEVIGNFLMRINTRGAIVE